MEVFKIVIDAVWGLLTMEFSLYGFTITLWQVHVVLFVVGLVFWVIARLSE